MNKVRTFSQYSEAFNSKASQISCLRHRMKQFNCANKLCTWKTSLIDYLTIKKIPTSKLLHHRRSRSHLWRSLTLNTKRISVIVWQATAKHVGLDQLTRLAQKKVLLIKITSRLHQTKRSFISPLSQLEIYERPLATILCKLPVASERANEFSRAHLMRRGKSRRKKPLESS